MLFVDKKTKTNTQVRKLFDLLDEDKPGFITVAELRKGLFRLSQPPGVERFKAKVMTEKEQNKLREAKVRAHVSHSLSSLVGVRVAVKRSHQKCLTSQSSFLCF